MVIKGLGLGENDIGREIAGFEPSSKERLGFQDWQWEIRRIV